MRLASEREGHDFLEKAQVWFNNADSALIFGDVQSIAVRAVAEYMANQEGLTIYNLSNLINKIDAG